MQKSHRTLLQITLEIETGSLSFLFFVYVTVIRSYMAIYLIEGGKLINYFLSQLPMIHLRLTK